MDFPSIRIISLPEAKARKEKMLTRLNEVKLKNVTWISAYKAESNDYWDIQNSILQSHLKALKEFLENSNEEFSIIMEDDINFDLVKLWPFTWAQKLSHLIRHRVDIFQMCLITMRVNDMEPNFHRRMPSVD